MTIRDSTDIPIVHKSNELYREIYKLGTKFPKRDKFGIHLKVENLCLDILTLGIEAALTSKTEKKQLLTTLRLKIEVLKHLVRVCVELGIIDNKIYLSLQTKLQEISKMAVGWLNYSS